MQLFQSSSVSKIVDNVQVFPDPSFVHHLRCERLRQGLQQFLICRAVERSQPSYCTAPSVQACFMHLRGLIQDNDNTATCCSNYFFDNSISSLGYASILTCAQTYILQMIDLLEVPIESTLLCDVNCANYIYLVWVIPSPQCLE